MDTTFPSLKSRKNKWRKQQDNCFFYFAFKDRKSSRNYQVGFVSPYHALWWCCRQNPFLDVWGHSHCWDRWYFKDLYYHMWYCQQVRTGVISTTALLMLLWNSFTKMFYNCPLIFLNLNVCFDSIYFCAEIVCIKKNIQAYQKDTERKGWGRINSYFSMYYLGLEWIWLHLKYHKKGS